MNNILGCKSKHGELNISVFYYRALFPYNLISRKPKLLGRFIFYYCFFIII